MSHDTRRSSLLESLREAAEGKQPRYPAELQQTDLEQERLQIARAIEAQAGVGLKREYWLKEVYTPFGGVSRRAVALLVVGAALWIGMLLVALNWRVTSTPDLEPLPRASAQTVMTHVYGNFPGRDKDVVTPFQIPENEIWRFNEAYTFWWDSQGTPARVVIASYDNQSDLAQDYRDRTRPINPTDYGSALFGSGGLVAEVRSLDVYGSAWTARRLGNMLLLVSSGANPLEVQNLSSHFVSIVGAEHREFIPTATPYQ